ncbi:MAG: hypothetical protein QMB78_00470, partial [Rhodospirillales bacterium]
IQNPQLENGTVLIKTPTSTRSLSKRRPPLCHRVANKTGEKTRSTRNKLAGSANIQRYFESSKNIIPDKPYSPILQSKK